MLGRGKCDGHRKGDINCCGSFVQIFVKIAKEDLTEKMAVE